MKKGSFLGCLVWSVWVIFCCTQQAYGNGRQVSLQEVLVDITKTSPAINEAIEHYRSVVAEKKIATSGYLPTVGAEVTVGPERTKGVSTEEAVETEDGMIVEEETRTLTSTTAKVYARQNLFNGWKTTSFMKETDARILAAAYDVLNTANSVYLKTAEAYINVVKAAKMLEIERENSLTQEKIMRQVREKTDAGFNRVSELYNSESRLARSKGNFISRQQDLNQALAVFHRQFGRVLSADQFIMPRMNYNVPATMQEAVDIALHKHPALKVAEHNIEKERYTFEKTSAAYWPSLDVELLGQYRDDTGGREGDDMQMGAYLTLSHVFYDGGLRAGEKLRDKQAIRKEHQRAYIERRNVNETVRLAWNIMAAEKEKKNYLDEHVKLSAKTLETFNEEYYVGRRTLLDLLNMENEHTDAKLSQTDSYFSYVTAVYRVMQATGELLDEHDTGLRELLGIPRGQRDVIADKVYDGLELNRDRDQTEDAYDQCDNSVPGSSRNYGCSDAVITELGYPHNSGELSPYLIPKGKVQTRKKSSKAP